MWKFYTATEKLFVFVTISHGYVVVICHCAGSLSTNPLIIHCYLFQLTFSRKSLYIMAYLIDRNK